MDEALLKKIVGMFRPRTDDFLNHPAKTVIQGPDDRAMFGFATNFPRAELIEDFGFTEAEADQFIAMVRDQA